VSRESQEETCKHGDHILNEKTTDNTDKRIFSVNFIRKKVQ
jgi:hypothetical protein